MKRLLLSLCAVIVFLAVLCGCGGVRRYNAEIVEEGYAFHEQFLKENMTKGADFPVYPEPCAGEDLPEARTFLFFNEGELNTAFESFPAVDFEQEMVAVYMWTAIYARDLELSDISLEEGDVLKIDFKYRLGKRGVGDACAPSRRILTVKLKKSDAFKAIAAPVVRFTLLNPRG